VRIRGVEQLFESVVVGRGQQRFEFPDDSVGSEVGRGHGREPSPLRRSGEPRSAPSQSDLCITKSRAEKPARSKKFFAWRWPGNAVASTPAHPAAPQKSTSRATSNSPTPTARASGST